MSYNERTQTFDDISTVSIAVGDDVHSRRIAVDGRAVAYISRIGNDSEGYAIGPAALDDLCREISRRLGSYADMLADAREASE